MHLLVTVLRLFMVGGTLGWLLEVVWRGAHAHRWIDPGFMTGPCLPIYGFGLLALYLLREWLTAVTAPWLRFALFFCLTMLLATLIEFIGGYIALRVYRTRLWDYRDRCGNILGLICPLYSFLWGVCGGAYYFLLDGALRTWLAAPLPDWGILLLGIYYGLFLADLTESLDLLAKLRQHAKAIRETVDLEAMREKARQYLHTHWERRRHPLRWLPHASLSHYLAVLREKREHRDHDATDTESKE